VRQIADHGDIDVLAALDRYDCLLGVFSFWLEVDQAVYACIGSLLLTGERNCVDQ
jgi:hypothetical protein